MAASTPTPQTYPPLLTKQQAAELYAVTPRTIDRWLLGGVLPADAKLVKGGSVRFRTAVLIGDINGTTTETSEGC